MAQLIISALGPDRPGLVGELTAHLHSSGANILDSRMVNLRGQFALVILIECHADAAGRLSNDLPSVGQKMGLNLDVTSQEASSRAAAPAAGIPYKLKTYSMDQPGIIARLTGVLRALGVNIEDLWARQESAAFAGSPLFLTEMRITIPPAVALGKLRGELEAVGNALNCDIDLDPAEG